MKLVKPYKMALYINALLILLLTSSAFSKSPTLREYLYPHPQTIKDISPAKIAEILQNGAWNTSGQSITSMETNNDSNPIPRYDQISNGNNSAGVNAFADIHFGKDVKRILDVGGGKYNVSRDYMHTKNIELLIWDPYCRTKKHNMNVQQEVEKYKADAATSMAVLNVIPEPEVRLKHIATLKHALKTNGYAYFKIWPGEGHLKGTNKAIVNAYGYPGYQANAYAIQFLPEVKLVFGVKNVALDSKVPNLIVAQKVTD